MLCSLLFAEICYAAPPMGIPAEKKLKQNKRSKIKKPRSLSIPADIESITNN
jgi:hypothetical protein